jgi:hypothetical protein
MILGGQ